MSKMAASQSCGISFKKSVASSAGRLQTAPAAKVCARKQLSVSAAAVVVESEVDVVSFTGEAKGKQTIKLKTAGENTNGLVHKYVVMYNRNKRQGNASTLTRGEVRGGGRKPMQQKGTGNARLGSTRTPLKPGGGVIFGPKPKSWRIAMNRKEKRLAMSSALQSATADMIVTEDIGSSLDSCKTKDMVAALKNWGLDHKKDHTLLLVKEKSDAVEKSGRNIAFLEIKTMNSMTVFDILRADKIVVEQSLMPDLEAHYSGDYSFKKAAAATEA